MSVEVVVLPAGGTEPLMRWEIRGAASVLSERWQELHRRLSSTDPLGPTKAAELYFCYLGPPFENHDRELIAALTAASKRHAAGARLHAVVDVHTLLSLDLTFELDAVADWYATARLGGLDDVLELPLDRESAAVLPGLLRAACARSEKREPVLARFLEKTECWSAVLAEREPSEISGDGVGILDPWVRYGLAGGTRDPVVVVVRDPESRAQRALVERVLDEHHPLAAVIAMLNCQVEDDLKAFCQQQRLGLLPFRGFLELRFFLLRLNSVPAAVALAEDRGLQPLPGETDLYSGYQAALGRLHQEIQPEHPRLDDFLAYEHRLNLSIDKLRRHGSSADERAELNQIVEQLNRLTSDVLGVSFNSLARPPG